VTDKTKKIALLEKEKASLIKQLFEEKRNNYNYNNPVVNNNKCVSSENYIEGYRASKMVTAMNGCGAAMNQKYNNNGQLLCNMKPAGTMMNGYLKNGAGHVTSNGHHFVSPAASFHKDQAYATLM